MIRAPRRPVTAPLLASLALAGGLAACSKGPAAGDGADLPSFNDVVTAPAPIQTAARAVVRVSTADEVATGSFVSDSGLLLTNDHVLGDGVCPLEGCYVQLTLMEQRGQPRQAPKIFFAVPVSVDVGLDLALVQLYVSPGGPKVLTSDHLTFRSETPASLLGMHVTVVGHPEGHLKKWTDGVVAYWSGSWFQSTAYILPGDSGSPALDDDGKIVGIVHRGPTGEDLFTSDGANVYSIGTASESIMKAMSAPSLPPVMISTAAATTAGDAVANDLVYLNARVPTVTVGSAPAAVLAVLGDACDAALAPQDFRSPDDLDAALTPCYDAMTWIECRVDAGPLSYGAVCPSAPDAVAWAGRFQAMNQRWRDMNGRLDLSPISFGLAHLAGSLSAGYTAGAQGLAQALALAPQPALDFKLAYYLAAFRVPSYAGESVAAHVAGYRTVPHYELEATYIASATTWLYGSGAMPRTQMLGILAALAADPQVSVGTRLFVEDVQYGYGAL